MINGWFNSSSSSNSNSNSNNSNSNSNIINSNISSSSNNSNSNSSNFNSSPPRCSRSSCSIQRWCCSHPTHLFRQLQRLARCDRVTSPSLRRLLKWCHVHHSLSSRKTHPVGTSSPKLLRRYWPFRSDPPASTRSTVLLDHRWEPERPIIPPQAIRYNSYLAESFSTCRLIRFVCESSR